MHNERYVKRYRWIATAIGGSFFGLGLCKLIELAFYESTQDMMQHAAWEVIVMTLGLIFAFTLCVVFPFQILVIERIARRRERMARSAQEHNTNP